MAKLIVEEQKDYPTLPPDAIIHVKVDELEVRTVTGARGDWDKLEFKFKILGILSVPSPDHPSNYDGLIGEKIYGSTPFRLTDSQENKLRLWCEAILNTPLERGFELDTDYLRGREVRALVSNYEKRAINPVTNRPFVAHQVQSLLPLGAGLASQPQQQFQQQPVAAGNQSWGAPAQAPVQDPWATQPQGSWNQQPQQPQQPQPGWGQQPVGGQQQFEEEPPF